MLDVAELDYNDYVAVEEDAVEDFITVYFEDGEPLIAEFKDGVYYELVKRYDVIDSEAVTEEESDE